MAAVTTSVTGRDVWGSHQVRFIRATFTSGYTNAGETITAALCDLNEIKFVAVCGGPSIVNVPLASVIVTQNGDSTILDVIDDAGILEGTTDLSGTFVDLIVIGI